MAEPAAEHPGYAWLMRNLERLQQTYPEQWAISDGNELVAHGTTLSELLRPLETSGRAWEAFAICYLTQPVAKPADDDGGGGRRATSPWSGGPGGGAIDIYEDIGVVGVPRRVLVPDASKS